MTTQAVGQSGRRGVTRRGLLRRVPVFVAGLSAASCGYALSGRGSFLPAYIKTLGIPMFGNTTPYQFVEQVFTQKVREEFTSSRRYTVVPTDQNVDGIVHGTIQGISLAPVGINTSQLATRVRVSVNVKVSFEDVKAQKTLWENPALGFSDEYELASSSTGLDVSAFFANDKVAFDRLSTDFARSVVSAILEAF